MALIKCNECGKEISDKATVCVGCGAPVRASSPPRASGSVASDESQYGNIFPGMAAGGQVKPKKIGLGTSILGAVVAGFVAYSCTSSDSPPGGTTSVSESRGLSTCKEAIRIASKDPDRAEIPYAKAESVGPEYVYTWINGVNTIRLRNGLGLDTPASATCAIGKASGKVNKLTVNGTTFINR